jgi:cold shock CspA family protein
MEQSTDVKAAIQVTGTVTSFDSDKGYGVVQQGHDKELFEDPTAIAGDVAYILAIGDRVRYVIRESTAGCFVSSLRAY